jgi:hypothetical protein
MSEVASKWSSIKKKSPGDQSKALEGLLKSLFKAKNLHELTEFVSLGILNNTFPFPNSFLNVFSPKWRGFSCFSTTFTLFICNWTF